MPAAAPPPRHPTPPPPPPPPRTPTPPTPTPPTPTPPTPTPPPARVLDEFGASGEPRALPGGQGTAWQCGQLVLKPSDLSSDSLDWLDEVVRPLATDRLRFSLPQRARSGGLEVDGWTAFPVLAGRHEAGRWLDIIAAGEAFADVLHGVGRPAFLEARDDPWARADRAAWGEEEIDGLSAVPHLGALLVALRSISAPSQLVHGDLTGNVLLHPTLPPAVIDLSLYWRPRAYGTAIVVVDAICFERAGLGLVEAADTGGEYTQQLTRALIFRIATDVLLGNVARLGGPADPYSELVGLVRDHMA